MSSDAAIVVEVRGKIDEGRVIKRNLDEIADGGDRAKSSVAALQGQMKALTSVANSLKAALAGMFGAFAIRELTQFVDHITTIQTQLRNVTQGVVDFGNKFSNLFAIAQRNGDAFGGLVQNFVRLNTSLPDSIRFTTDLTKVTDLLSRGFAASGTAAQTAGSVLTQLTQGLSGNFANAAQELNSLIEGAPLLARTIAEQLGGKAATDLKKLAEAGELTAQSFLAAVLNAEKAIKSFEIPATIERSWQRVKNAFVELGSESRALAATTSTITTALDLLADNLSTVIDLSFVLAATAIPRIVTSVTALLIPSLAGLTGSLTALRNVAATAFAFLGGIPGILAAAGAAIWIFWDEIVDFTRKFEPFGLKISYVFASIADVIAYTFSNIVESIKKSIAEAEILLFKVTDKIANTAIGKRLGIETYTPSVGAITRSQESYSDIAKRIVDERSESGFLYREMTKDIKSTSQSLSGPNGLNTALGIVAGSTKDAEKNYKALQSAIGQGRTQEQDLISRLNELEKLRPFIRSAEDAAGLENAIKNTRAELDKLRIDVEKDSPLGRAFKSIADEIEDGFKDAFKDAFSETDGGWKKLLEGWKATFKNFLAEMAYQALVRPIVLQVVSGVGQGMGLSSGAVNSILGTAGSTSSGSLGGIGDILGLGKNLFGGSGNGIMSNLGGLSNLLGYGPAGSNIFAQTLPSGVFGPAAPGSVFGGTTFGQFGMGAGIGSLAANVLGLGSGNMIVDTGLGLAGAALGQALIPIPGLGAGIGSFLGTALGGVFGGESIPSMAIQRNFATQNGQYVLVHSGQDESTGEQQTAFDTLSNLLTSKVNEFTQLIGATLVDAPYAVISQTRREGIRVGVNGVTPGNVGDNFDKPQFGDLDSAVSYALSTILSNATFSGLSDDIATVVKNALTQNPGDINAAVSDIQFAQSLLSEAATPMEAVAKAIEEINGQFDSMIERAERLGLPMEKVTETLEKQRETAVSTVKAMQAGFSSMEQMATTFKAFLDGQALGDTSSLSPMGKLTLAQDNFGSLLSKVQGGDYSATQELLGAAQQLLVIGRNVHASSVNFSALESFVRSSITQIGKDLEIPGFANGTPYAPGGYAWVGERGPELVKFRGGEQVHNHQESMQMIGRVSSEAEARMGAIAQDIESMRSDMKMMASGFNRLANKMAASR